MRGLLATASIAKMNEIRPSSWVVTRNFRVGFLLVTAKWPQPGVRYIPEAQFRSNNFQIWVLNDYIFSKFFKLC